MVSGMARLAQEQDPRKVRVFFDYEQKWHEAWENNPRIARIGEKGSFQKLVARVGFRRPYIAGKSPTKWTWRECGEPPRGEIYFSDSEREFGERHAGLIIIEPNIKSKASPNKDWGWERWQALATMLADSGLRATQLGPAGTRLLAGTDWLETPSMRLAAAVMARARAAALPEGGLHHVANAVGTPAVVIFGGYISPAITGYASQASFFVDASGYEIGCGMRARCDHCAKAMAKIEPAAVARALMERL